MLAIGIILVILNAILFFGSCVIMTTDAQGAFVFILSIPLILLDLAATYYLAKKLGPTSGHGKSLWRAFQAHAIFGAFFMISLFVPVLQVFPLVVVGITSKAFEFVVGKTPYQWAKDRNDAGAMVQRELEKSKGQRLDLRKLPTPYDWNTACFLPPYTDQKQGSKIMGFDWPEIYYHRISTSDGITLLVLHQDKSVSYYIELKRPAADFAKIEPKCFPREKAVFELGNDGFHAVE